jgi:hypothetical protein
MTDTPAPTPEGNNAAKAEGFFARQISKVKANLGGEALKASKGKYFARVGGVTLGAILVAHGLLKSQTQGEDGQMVDRGIGIRALETVAGLGIATGSAVVGGR